MLEEDFLLEDDTYWTHTFDGYTLYIPKIYEKIRGFDCDYIYQDKTKKIEKHPILDLKDYNEMKWDWIREHCTTTKNPSIIYYTPKKKEELYVVEKTTTEDINCCIIC